MSRHHTQSGPGGAPVRPPAVTPAHFEALRTAAVDAGQVVVRLDLAGCADKASLLAAASAAFRFPDWFGRNWDALSDSLGDLSWLDAPGYLVLVENPQRLETEAPEVWNTLCEILEEVAAERGRQGVVWRTVLLARQVQ